MTNLIKFYQAKPKALKVYLSITIKFIKKIIEGILRKLLNKIQSKKVMF